MNENELTILDHINKNLRKLQKSMYKSNSLKWNFFKGLVSGVGYTIGATIIFGILLAILSKTINTVDDVPVLNKIIQTIQIDGVIEESN
ncbi:MAG: DUF5665 domain-containing protein [Patescibacteria group bacterium]|nr:hypothetical protein [Patescibacteria group bacterium]